MKKLKMQEAICCNMYAIVDEDKNEITGYICKVTGGAPRCHLKVTEAGWIELEKCADRI